MKLKKGDLIILIILAAAAVSWLAVNQIGASGDDRRVVIEVDGSIYTTLPFNEGVKPQEIHIELNNGNHIDIVVDKTGAYVKDVVCPDRICQKTGIVNKVGQSIVCLPNRVVVYIEGETISEVDDVSF